MSNLIKGPLRPGPPYRKAALGSLDTLFRAARAINNIRHSGGETDPFTVKRIIVGLVEEPRQRLRR
jgi:hypothetical protein